MEDVCAPRLGDRVTLTWMQGLERRARTHCPEESRPGAALGRGLRQIRTSNFADFSNVFGLAASIFIEFRERNSKKLE